ncbi:MAG: trans-aconitate 2-methyltransferase [Mycolicibacterium sp.]|uniref:class I SAM-dependent methyltransferase n=1 Tax=Mycolicibacterium sp. TaxID=2320850 RepID=UPI003D149288
MNDSIDYHDYVFRDGKLVGEFEAMYQNSAIVPWHQDEQGNWMDVRLTREILRELGSKFDEIHDLGCGTGNYLDLIAREFLSPGGENFGYDISATACKRAAESFPGNHFSVLDLTKEITDSNAHIRTARQLPSRLFMIRGTLWYVFPALAEVISNIARLMTGSDKLLVVQNFPPLDSQFIGKEAIPNQLALIEHFSCRFVLDSHIWYEKRLGSSNDNWFIGIFRLLTECSRVEGG